MTSVTSGDLVHCHVSAYYCNSLNLHCLSTVSWRLRSWLSRSGWRKMTWSRRQQRSWRPRNPGGSLIMSWSSTRPRSAYLWPIKRRYDRAAHQRKVDMNKLCDLSDQPTDQVERAAEGTFQHSKTYRHVRTSSSFLQKFVLIFTFLSWGIAKMLSKFDSVGLFMANLVIKKNKTLTWHKWPDQE